ncbi:MAG: hypothetical protein AAF125_27205 [Chloroflexota bacterium]
MHLIFAGHDEESRLVCPVGVVHHADALTSTPCEISGVPRERGAPSLHGG